MYEYRTARELMAVARKNSLCLVDAVIAAECEETELSGDEVRRLMTERWHLMMMSARKGIKEPKVSVGGLIGGNSVLLNNYGELGRPLVGHLACKAAAYALAVSEVNATMGRVVAAPTAGSSGILPGVLLALMEQENYPEEKIVEALFVAGAIGNVIAMNATLSGAQGGCQAECGSASAMAAGAAVYLRGGSEDQIFDAAALAIKNLLGLVCDPVAGLVEVPCSKRNAGGVVNGLMAADLALAGIKSVIPFDEMVGAMGRVGRQLPVSLRETALGGCAATPTGMKIREEINKTQPPREY